MKFLKFCRRRVFRPRSDTLSMKPLTPPNNIELNSYHRYGSNNGRFDSPVHQGTCVAILWAYNNSNNIVLLITMTVTFTKISLTVWLCIVDLCVCVHIGGVVVDSNYNT